MTILSNKHTLQAPLHHAVTYIYRYMGLTSVIRNSHTYSHSRNVILFGVPESRNLLDTESLVSRALEFAVGRKIEFVDCRRLGRYSQGQKRNRPLATCEACVSLGSVVAVEL